MWHAALPPHLKPTTAAVGMLSDHSMVRD